VLGAATQSGGGVYLIGDAVRLNASGLRIEHNVARSFAAGLMIVGAQAALSRGEEACAPGEEACSSLSHNEVRDASGNLSGTNAAAFVAGSGAPSLSLAQTRVVGNAAGSGVLGVGDGASLRLESVLISGNQSAATLLQVQASARATLDFVTLAGNTHTGVAIFNSSTAPDALLLRRSILQAAPGQSLVGGAGISLGECLNTTNGVLGGDNHDPGYFDAAAAVYRLRRGSANLDRCAVLGGEAAVDIDGQPRLGDDPQAPNLGTADRGAYEGVEDLYADGFE
jgi:hypothetical protein